MTTKIIFIIGLLISFLSSHCQTSLVGDFYDKKNNSYGIEGDYFTLDTNVYFEYKTSSGFCNKLMTTINHKETDSVLYKYLADLDYTINHNIGTYLGVGYFLAYDYNGNSSLWATRGNGSTTHKILDLGKRGSITTRLMPMNGKVFFFAELTGYKDHLYFTDGTKNGTRSIGIFNYKNGVKPYVYGNKMYFMADGDYLVISDGTLTGTFVDYSARGPSGFIGKGNRVYFFYNGDMFASTDGTKSGLTNIKDLHPLFNFNNNVRPSPIILYKNDFYFFAVHDSLGMELWKSDGTNANTKILKDLNKGSKGLVSHPIDSNWFKINSKYLFFIADNGSSGLECFRTDGTSLGTIKIRDLNPGSKNGVSLSNSSSNYIYNDKFYFNGTTGNSKYNLWVSEGDSSNTVQVFSTNGFSGHNPSNFIEHNGMLLYTGWDVKSSLGTQSIYVLDKSGRPPAVLLDKNNNQISPKIGSGGFNKFWVKASRVLYFSGTDSIGYNHPELYRTDATSNGTWRLNEVSNATDTFNNRVTPRKIATFKGKWVVPIYTHQYKTELWTTDGQFSGSKLLLDIGENHISGYGSHVVQFKMNGKFIFSASNVKHGQETWISNGDSSGTKMLKDIIPGSNSGSGNFYKKFGNEIFGTAYTLQTGRELFKTDGTDTGTVLVKNIWTGISGNGTPNQSQPSLMGVVNNNLVFIADSANMGKELWVSDGTTNGTKLLKDIYPGNGRGSLWVSESCKCRGLMFFGATDNSGHEIWKTDGTLSGTQRVKDIYPGSIGATFSHPVCMDSIVYFSAKTSTLGYELWRSDGTSSGTYLVKDLNPGTNSSDIREMIAIDSTLYFTAYGGTNAVNNTYQVWKSNGTANGTVQVSSLPTPPSHNVTFFPSDLAPFNGALVFSAYTKKYGREPYISYGSSSSCSTYMLDDIKYDRGSSDPKFFTEKGDSLLFWAKSDMHGYELRYFKMGAKRKMLLSNPLSFYSCKVSQLPVFQASFCGEADSVRWVVRKTLTNNWIPVFDGLVYSGSTSDSLQLKVNDPAMNLFNYRLVAYRAGFDNDTSEAASLNINYLSFSVQTRKTTCYGTNTGWAKINANGSTGGYHYSWQGYVVDTNEVGFLKSGNLKVIVSDQYGCSVDSFIKILETDSIYKVSGISTSPTCANGSDGSLQISINGGTGSYSYKWDSASSITNIANMLRSGTYSIHVTDSLGCRVTFSDVVQTTPIIRSTTRMNSCQEDTVYFLGNKFLNSGTFIDTTNSVNGCDSIVTLVLNKTNFNDSVIVNKNVLNAQHKSADAYQWLECNSGYSILPGKNADSLIGAPNKEYAVLITVNGCSDTSDCFKINVSSVILNNQNQQVKVYPNPVNLNHQIIIESAQDPIKQFKIMNPSGRIEYSSKKVKLNSVTFTPIGLKPGVYTIHVFLSSGSTAIKKLTLWE